MQQCRHESDRGAKVCNEGEAIFIQLPTTRFHTRAVSNLLLNAWTTLASASSVLGRRTVQDLPVSLPRLPQ